MAMDDALDLAHFKTLLEQRAAELDRLLEDAESRSQSVELDQSKVEPGYRGCPHRRRR